MQELPMPDNTSNANSKEQAGFDKLSEEREWSERWEERGGAARIEFDPRSIMYRDLDDLFKRHLPKSNTMRVLEIGAYPGSKLWYFHKTFGYQPDGLEYVDWCCPKGEELMRGVGIDAKFICADLFEYEPPKEKWDVVASFGFIEHFDDTANVIARHAALIKAGGYLVITLPNHSGFNGSLLKRIDRALYNIHNQMDYKRLLKGIADSGADLEILEGGYFGRVGFWNIGLYRNLKKRLGRAYPLARAPLWGLERLGRVAPNSKFLSPYITVIARLRSDFKQESDDPAIGK